jgi:hypothetical protein
VIIEGIVIILREPDQDPNKKGKNQTDDENRQLVPEFHASPLTRVADEFKKIGLQIPGFIGF